MWYFVSDPEHEHRPFWCSESLLAPLLRKLRDAKRAEPKVQQMDKLYLDPGGIIMNDDPDEEFALEDGTIVVVRSRHFHLVHEALARIPWKLAALGPDAEAICYSIGFHKLLLPLPTREEIVSKMGAMLPAVEDRAMKAEEKLASRLQRAVGDGARIISPRLATGKPN